jgi:membrane-associated phospholipid phosphatase
MKSTAARKPLDKRYLFIIISALFLLVLSTLLAASNRATVGLEYRLIGLIYAWPEFLTWFFIALTQLGSVWMAFGVVIGLAFKQYHKLSLRLLAAVFSAYLLVILIKQFIARPRPFELFPEVVSRELLVSDYGFPSGHTAIAAAISLSLLPIVPRKFRWVLVTWPVLVGLSRIYLGVHAPLDIIGGLAIGIAVAFGFMLTRRITAMAD